MTLDATKERTNFTRKELRLPQIDAESCVHHDGEGVSCRACVESCPRHAWLLNDELLGLDTAACDGCGLCVAACPTGALSISFPWVIRSLGGNPVALVACERSGVEAEEARIPCIHALGLRQLLLMHRFGIHYLLVLRGRCTECDRRPRQDIDQRVDEINALLKERDAPTLRLLERSPTAWKALLQSKELIPEGPKLARREFLRGGLPQIRRQMLSLDPLNHSDLRVLPPGELLPPPLSDGPLHWPHLPAIDEERCCGCDACARLCPTGAVRLTTGTSVLAYRIDPARCQGCGICVSACETGAMEIRPGALGDRLLLPLEKERCTACGAPYHEPRVVGKLCQVCRKTNHPARLFQVVRDS